MKKTHIPLLIFLVLILSGCEVTKSVLGISTRKLENAIPDGISKSYKCGLRECYEAILALDHNEPDLEPQTEKYFEIFMKKPEKGQIIVMGIPGQVDTTEVGIFLSSEGGDITRIDIASLSTQAKEKVANAVFTELDSNFITP
jgi:hypothetical protein